jgi:hypothetical protein
MTNEECEKLIRTMDPRIKYANNPFEIKAKKLGFILNLELGKTLKWIHLDSLS